MEADNSLSLVSFTELLEDIVRLLDFIRRLKNEKDQTALDMDQIEKLKLQLKSMWTSIQLSYTNLDGLSAEMSNETQHLEDLLKSIFYGNGYDMLVKYDMDQVVPRLLENIRSCISSQHHPKSSVTLTMEQLVEPWDALLAKLRGIVAYPELCSSFLPQYEVLQNLRDNVRDFLGLKLNGCIEHEIVEYVLPQIQLMVERVRYFNLEFLNTLGPSPVMLAHLLVKIIPVALEFMHICSTDLKASKSAEVGRFIKQLLEASPDIFREYLIHLQEHMVNVITTSTSARNLHVMIEFLLIILTDMPNGIIHHDKLFDLIARVGALTREVATLVLHLEEKSRNEENTNESNITTLDLQENIELLKEDLKHFYLKVPSLSQLCFPMSDRPLFMNLLLINLNDLLNSNSYSVALIKEEIALVKEHLELIRFFFVNVEKELYKDQWIHALNVAYEAEHAINSILVRDHGLLHLIFLLPDIIEKIKIIKEEVFNLSKKIPKNMSLIVANSPNKPVVRNSAIANQVIVGFEEERNWIIRKLISGPAEIDVISIIGMAGLGKTTLASRVYNDESVVSHFDILAWCTVDQEHDGRKLLHKIVNQATGSNEKFNEDIDVADELRRKLYGRRYLIVLDDVWDTATWDELTRSFPEVKKGSRIILTSRKKEVALHGKHHCEPLYLRLLSLDESWELLEKRIFGEESCPDELLGVGKGIARKCQGLPLVADLIARVIATKEKKKTLWLEVLNNLNSFILENELEVMKIIQLSYDHLPDHVKPCLLYLGSYPKDEQIEVSRLQDLWTAEGLVEHTEMKSVEDEMNVYLDALISSSLVMVMKSEYRTTTCKIHDLVHDFCQVKATKEKFFHSIGSSALSCASDLMPRRITVSIHYSLLEQNHAEKKKVSGKYLLSLKADHTDWPPFGLLVDKTAVLVHLRDLKLLRVLDIAQVLVEDSLLNEIGLLVHLRYLHIGMNVKALPSSLSNLWNLETLVVRNSRSTMVLLPVIWNLAKLRHMSIYYCSFFDLDSDEPILLVEDSNSKLEKLRILEQLKISNSKDTEDIFKRFPNLQKLDCEIVESWDSSAECNWFPQLDVLNQLEEINATHRRLDSQFPKATKDICKRSPNDFCFPSSLKRLTLEEFYLSSDSLSKISRLPNLQKLTLNRTMIQEEEWNVVEEDTFKNLKYLELYLVCLSKWQVGEESFPVLEQLILAECNRLEEIPSSFGDIASLSCIKLFNSPQLEYSAQEIKEYVADMMGEDKLQVLYQSYR
ncbi:putative late blight resistance protein homolog R1A-3 [Nicotiana tabacum]|uniref:Late blight resistance protein homolog R1B-16 isoform X1 n=1 Tax=Nicotiana tabacum TaxID=4097 RepID=A0A1S3YSZ6_TOBAC|nr:PREDICTED: putative late blight resistance protein homolog R1B-16 isoform X1 [Nicotiana tabacum]XP_016455361.1 PREDICTED: putative late blight resistance protein homolog R1B-16 isoform X1 [Nicotiana tabacum]